MTLKNLVIAGLPNPVSAALTEITAGAEGSDMLADRLKIDEPDDVARLTSVFPHLSWWEVDFKVPTAVQALMLEGNSLVPGDQVRVIGVESGSLPDVRSETVAPDAVVEEDAMLDATIGRIDEHPSSPDGDKATFFTGGSFIRVSFGTPAAVPAVGTHLQAFLVWVNTSSTPANPEDYPSLRAELWENGVFRADLGTKVPTDTTGQLLIFPWTAGDLANGDGSQVELKLIQDQPAGLRVILLDAIAWECLHQSDADAADLDTGWASMPGAEADEEFGDTSVQEVDIPSGSWSKLLSSPATVERIRIEIRGDGAGFHGNLQVTQPRPPATYIDAGYFIAAPIFHAPYRFAPGGVLRVHRSDVGGTGITGSNRSVTQWRRRECEVQLPILAERTAHVLWERLARIAGVEQAFLVCLEPGSTDERVRRDSTFLAFVAEAGPISYPGDGIAVGAAGQERARGVSFMLAEKL